MQFLKYYFLMVLLYATSLFPLCKTLFTPRDDIKSYLLQVIKSERKSIDCAMYMFTDKVIAQALIDAYVRGVKVRVVLDHISMGDRYGKGQFLQNNGITVFVHYASNYNPFTMPIMHHKFFIFGGSDLYPKGAAWTGSFNCTQSAARLNDENVLISDEQEVIKQYRQCFHDLMIRCGNKNIEELVEEEALQ